MRPAQPADASATGRRIQAFMSKGYFYIVTGKKYRDEMLVSFQQLRQHTKLPICIASDEKPAIECDHFIHITDPKFTYQDKVLNLDRTPFDETRPLQNSFERMN